LFSVLLQNCHCFFFPLLSFVTEIFFLLFSLFYIQNFENRK
jgi:hypothetical protein